MSHRIQHRRGNGRWRGTTLADFGIENVQWCPHCRIGNPSTFGQARPTTCHDCGKSLSIPAAPSEDSHAKGAE